ncbi:MAG: hypothetical protein N3E36_01605 [Sulfolobales archaeon]|nr:hypothetical protein [Sulfolobales archaeon]MCX8198710.1 hypothetical protein [Sulfolobales archaeon]MDW8169783.1 hypothetical protein [Desulfurococcaceae archaeon]
MGLKELLKEVFLGVASGAVSILIYVYLAPLLIYTVTKAPIDVSWLDALAYVSLFIALGIAERTSPGSIAAPIRVLSKLIGALVLLYITNYGVLHGEYSYAEGVIVVKIDASPIIYLILLLSLVYGVVDAYTAVIKHEEI